MLLAGQGTLESLAQFLTALFIFIFVLLITWFTTRLIGNMQKQRMTGTNIEVIETTKITPSKYLQIIRAGEKYLLIAVCKDTVTMLTELSEDSLISPADSRDDQTDFGNLLEKARIKLSGRNTEKEQAERDEE